MSKPEMRIESPLFCDRCAKELHPGSGDFHVVNIEAFADPSPIEFSEEDISRDHGREYQRLLDALWEMSPQEAMDSVYRRLTIFLCNPCYAEWIENPLGDER